MKRVAALWLPNWPIDRIMKAEPMLAPPPEHLLCSPHLLPLRAEAGAEQAQQCDVPRASGWRPGARWARQSDAVPKGQTCRDLEMQIAALSPQCRPLKMLGRRSEPVDTPFQRLADNIGKGAMGALPAKSVGQLSSGPLLVTTHKISGRTEIVAVSPAARARGVVRGMSLTQARASHPNMLVRDATPKEDAAALHELAILLARRWAPVVALSGVDSMFIDLTGVAHLHGGEAVLAKRLIHLLARHGFAARVAIADTAGAAWALAHHGAGAVHICAAGAQEAAIAPLPATALRLSDPAITLLRRLGVERVADVLALPRAPLVRRFGAEAARRLDQALGHAPEPLDPVIPVVPIRVEERFPEPIATAEAIGCWLDQLVPKLCEELAMAGKGARMLALVAERVDGVPQIVKVGLARPSHDPVHILRLLRSRIEEIAPGYGIDAVGLHVIRAQPLTASSFSRGLEEAAPDLAPLIDMLANRGVPCWRYVPVESHVPERSVLCVDALVSPDTSRRRVFRDDVRQLDQRPADHPWSSCRPRPVRLLPRPERLDHVIAELPDQPPRRFTWRGRRHVVVRADGPERIAGEWWRRAAERDAVRDYFRVEDEEGDRYWIFRRGDGERSETGDLSWYLHGLFG